MERSNADRGGIIAAFILVILFNSLANALPLGGVSTGEVSARYPSLFTPAGFTFGIWGVIYLALGVFTIWQALPGQRSNAVIARISGPFIANCAANIAWLFAWHYELLWLSLLFMLVILGTLLLIYREVTAEYPQTRAELLILRMPFSIYLGWITVATIANITCVQVGMGWESAGLSAVDWTLLKLGIAGAIGAVVIARVKDIAYILVIAWAAFGVASNQADTPAVAGAATTLAILAVLLALNEAVRKAPH
jgi:hypothetical protein